MANLVHRCCTLPELLSWRASVQTDRRAFTYLTESGEEHAITYGELNRQARSFAARLQDRNAHGERALLLYQPGLEYVGAFFGCLYAGVVPVPAYPPRMNGNLGRLQSVAQDAGAKFALTSAAIHQGIERRFAEAAWLQELSWLVMERSLGSARDDSWQLPELKGDQLAFLQYTSGSTSQPKGVMLTHNNLLSNLEMIERSFGTTAEDRGVVWLPPYHDMGLIGGILQPLYTGYQMTLMAPVDFIQKPLRWLETISRLQATVSGGPNFAYELCLRKITPEQRDRLDLSHWKIAFSGAEPVRSETLDQFSHYFGKSGFRSEAFYPCYGLAEGTLFVTGGAQEEAPIVQTLRGDMLEQNQAVTAIDGQEGNRTLVSSGRPALSRQQVVIVDAKELTACADDHVGEIWVSGPSVAHGYWGRPDQTEETFQAYLADTGEGPFLRTGDLGFIRDGELYVTGRLKDLLIIRGRNYYPQDIEFCVQECHPAVKNSNGAVFAVEEDGEERLVIVQEIERQYRKGDHEEVVRKIRQAVAEQFQLQAYAVILIKPASIAKTSSGKVQRHACKQRFLDGTLQAVYASQLGSSQGSSSTGEASNSDTATDKLTRDRLMSMSEAERSGALQAHLLRITAQVLKVSPVQIEFDQPINAFGLDSLMAVELKNEIEENFGVDLSPVDFLEGANLATLTAKVMEQMGEREVSGNTEAGELLPSVAKQEFPLTHGQRALWFLQRLAPDHTMFNLSRAVALEAELDLATFRTALGGVIERHPLLRATIVEKEGEPVQQVQAQVEPHLMIENAGSWSEEQLQKRLQAEANRPFDLQQGPLLRVHLFVRADRASVLLLTIHHLVIDFWSFNVMLDEMWRAYADLKRAKLPVFTATRGSFADYVAEQSRMLAAAKGERLWSYWQQQLGDAQTVLSLPTDRPRPAVQTYNGSSHTFRLSEALTRQLKSLAKEQGVTMYVLLMAAFQTLLHRYSGQTDILVGSPTACRPSARYAETVGYFVNPVAVRGNFAEQPTFGELLHQMRHAVLGALEHQEYPLSLLVERLQLPRNPSYSPLFQVMFTFQKSHVLDEQGLTGVAMGEAGTRLTVAGLDMRTVPLAQHSTQMDLWLTMGEVEGELSGSFEFNTDLFERSTIERMIGHFQTLLMSASQDVDRPVGDLQLLTESELSELLVKWNDTSVGDAVGSCIHQLFEAQVERTPNRTAVVFEGRSLTYSELNRRADQLAALLRERGVGPEKMVGLCMERSLEMIVGLLGILKAGGAYVPLDPTYPAERISFILDDAQVSLLLTQPHVLPQLSAQQVQTVLLDHTWEAVENYSDVTISSGVKPEHLAYMIYTSGSTGLPKGVMIEHRNVANFFIGMDQRIGCSEDDTILAVTSICFDISVLELFWTLVRGAKVVLLSEREASGGLARTQTRKTGNGMEFSLFYFASDEQEANDGEKYRLLMEGAKYADRNGFAAVWTPERHFHQFGGLYPNPAVISSALAMVTDNIELRAGSVVLPLNSPIRVVEDWSVVDHLSRGRVALSFASGWHADDFVLAPENYKDRTNRMFEEIQTVQKLWRGEALPFVGGVGQEVMVQTLPRPMQKTLSVYVTSGGNLETFRRAGEIGAHLLTHLLGQTVEELAEKISVYRQALLENGYDPQSRRVALMLHTFLGESVEEVREKVRQPFTDYLRSSFGLVENLVRSAQLDVDLNNLSAEDREGILGLAFERYFETSGLFGTPETCYAVADRLKRIGVDEIACLIDFGVESDQVIDSLDRLNELRRQCKPESRPADEEIDFAKGDTSLAGQAAAHRATMMQCTPSLMKILSADRDKMAALRSLRALMLGGEEMPAKLAEELRHQLPDVRLINMYGPTEATVWATTFEVTQTETVDRVPIGRPFANVKTYVLDSRLRPLPIGVPGELHIGGDSLARGYHKRPELTAEKFIADPFAEDPSARMYKTGDLVQYLADGNIKFLGRIDDQVKIRGFRIELGEIEKVLVQHRAVREAAIVDREDLQGEKYIAAYVVFAEPHASQPPESGELRAFLQDKLPDFMIPSVFVTLDWLPLTPNGKMDRKALPDPKEQRANKDVAYVAPQNEMEVKLAKIWQEVLLVEKVGIHDNFFEIGGHSLQAVQVHKKLTESFFVDIPIVQLFQYPTISALTKFLSQGEQGKSVAKKGRERAASRREILQERGRIRDRKKR